MSATAMNVLAAYARMYGWCLSQALKAISKNAWTLLLPLGLTISMIPISMLARTLGPLSGYVVGFLFAAAFSCYLYFVGEVVAKSKVTLAELKKSFGAYFWSLLNLGFVLWIANTVLGFALAANHNRGVITAGLNLVMAIVLNPSPEIIYQRGTRGGLDTITSCFRFLQESWVEWLIPHAAIAGAVYALTRELPGALLMPGFMVSAGSLPGLLVAGLLGHVLMVYRGFLFAELEGSSHRQRLFRFNGKNVP